MGSLTIPIIFRVLVWFVCPREKHHRYHDKVKFHVKYCKVLLSKEEGDATQYAACKDGGIKSRCPCLEHEQGYSSLCSYVICENMHGVRSRPSSRPSGVKRERSLGFYQRLKGSEFLSSARVPQIRGPWTNYESVL